MKDRVPLFGIKIDPLTLEQAARTVLQWSARPFTHCRFVVTPNVDHLVMLRESGLLREVYADAHLVLADGWPVVTAARLLGKPLPERVAGSDLVPRLFQLAATPLRVFLLGAMPGVADKAKQRIETRWPNMHVVGTFSPPLGFEKDAAQCEAILDRIAADKPRSAGHWPGCSQAGAMGASVSCAAAGKSRTVRGSHHRFPGWRKG